MTYFLSIFFTVLTGEPVVLPSCCPYVMVATQVTMPVIIAVRTPVARVFPKNKVSAQKPAYTPEEATFVETNSINLKTL